MVFEKVPYLTLIEKMLNRRLWKCPLFDPYLKRWISPLFGVLSVFKVIGKYDVEKDFVGVNQK